MFKSLPVCNPQAGYEPGGAWHGVVANPHRLKSLMKQPLWDSFFGPRPMRSGPVHWDKRNRTGFGCLRV